MLIFRKILPAGKTEHRQQVVWCIVTRILSVGKKTQAKQSCTGRGYELCDSEPKKQLDTELSPTQLKVDLKNFAWILECLNLASLQGKGTSGTWGESNSLAPKASVVMDTLLILLPSTDIKILYSILMYIQKISKNLHEESHLLLWICNCMTWQWNFHIVLITVHGHSLSLSSSQWLRKMKWNG